MEIEGTYTLQATPNEVWNCLIDQELWSQSVAGIERVEPIDADVYRVTIHLNQPALSGTYIMRATITEQHAPYYCRFTLGGDNGQLGTLDGFGTLHLNQHESQTIIAYKGNLPSNVLDETGTPVSPLVVKGAVKLLLQQFFTALSERVDEEHFTYQDRSDAGAYTDETFVAHEQHITIPSPVTYPRNSARRGEARRDEAHSRLRWFVHLLRIGKGNPAEEIRWAQRIRRFSIASVLLFLVWVGTRIPRR